MRLLISSLLFTALLAQQQPLQFPSVNRKARQLTAQEAEDWRVKQIEATRANNELELAARRLCESIHVELQSCGLEAGYVFEKEKPATPAVTPQSATPIKPQQPEAPKPTEVKPPAK
jgi:hypothetical protein